jgi:hypothetical protein
VKPLGRLVILTLQDALGRIEALEHRVALVEKMLVGEWVGQALALLCLSGDQAAYTSRDLYIW